jgi:hypothetical protein
MAKYKTIQELLDAIKAGELNQKDIRVVLDNDVTTVEMGYWVDGVDEEDPEDLYSGNGYMDVEDLWPLLLPEAKVEWC